jgi:hypothetical protein
MFNFGGKIENTRLKLFNRDLSNIKILLSSGLDQLESGRCSQTQRTAVARPQFSSDSKKRLLLSP